MKNISTLIKDIYHVVEGKAGWLDKALAEEFAGELGLRLVEAGGPRDEVPRLRLSQMGDRCPCALWHSIHSSSLQEALPAPAKIKFTYGHIIEALVIAMAKAAGHEVLGEQDAVVVDGITGHRDCVIDGCIVDVKSASSMSYKKFKDGSIRMDDPFGYLAQLDGYAVGSADDDIVKVKDKAYLLAVDKTLGHMCTYEHTVRPDFIKDRIRRYKRIVSLDAPPPCECGTVADGESGNIKLDVPASYNNYKFACAESRGERIRTFLYEGGPRFLTKVVRRPMRRDNRTPIPEVDRHGVIVYN